MPRGCCSRSPNLLEDAEVRFTTTGIAVACLRVAVRQRIQQHCEWRDGETNFLKVNVWHGQADHDEIGASLKFATAKVERATERGSSDRAQERERQAERGGDL